MTLLNDFRTDVRLNSLYRARLDFEREHFARAKALAEESAAKDAALAEAAVERAAKEAALAAKERLAARLRALGVDPDAE